jgi:hypothetical protein
VGVPIELGQPPGGPSQCPFATPTERGVVERSV